MPIFDKLPAELMLHVLRALDSPLDLRSFLSACPGAYQYLNDHRRHVLQPSVDSVLEKLEVDGEDEDLLSVALRVARFRHIHHRLAALDYPDAAAKVDEIIDLPVPKAAEWKGNLAIVCHLFSLASETNRCIERCMLEPRQYGEPPEDFSMLPEDDKFHLGKAMWEFEIHHHAILDHRRPFRTIEQELLEAWQPETLRSKYNFIFGRYQRLVERVERREDPSASEFDSNGTWRFRQGTAQELEYVALLCLWASDTEGIDGRRMDIKQLRYGTLMTFLWVCVREAPPASHAGSQGVLNRFVGQLSFETFML